jgi:hypothetical protein
MRHCYKCGAEIAGGGFRRAVDTGNSRRRYVSSRGRVSSSNTTHRGLSGLRELRGRHRLLEPCEVRLRCGGRCGRSDLHLKSALMLAAERLRITGLAAPIVGALRITYER